MFEFWHASRPTPESTALLERVRDAGRTEAQAAAERLVAIGELFVLRCQDSGERADWAMDTRDAVAAQVAAALQTSMAMGSSYLRYALAMRDRLPEVGKVFQAGDIDYRALQTIVFRTDLLTDAEALAQVDAQLAVLKSRCPPRSSDVVIHVVAEQSTVDGTGTTPGVSPGVEGLIPAELVAELAKSARLQPLICPVDAPEPGYTPSAKLADFVRCRDLTCRAPGCDRPAVDCDVDHTVAYSDGGCTHPSNLKCLCRRHHLLKTFWTAWRDEQRPDGTANLVA